MERGELIAFMRRAPYWVQASVAAGGAPQAAVVGVAVSDELELVFDTLATTRKAQNLRREPRVAFAMWVGEATVQLEGIADEPQGDERARLIAVYLARFPDGVERQSWPGICYFRVRPTWLRFTDFAADPPRTVELRP